MSTWCRSETSDVAGRERERVTRLRDRRCCVQRRCAVVRRADVHICAAIQQVVQRFQAAMRRRGAIIRPHRLCFSERQSRLPEAEATMSGVRRLRSRIWPVPWSTSAYLARRQHRVRKPSPPWATWRSSRTSLPGRSRSRRSSQPPSAHCQGRCERKQREGGCLSEEELCPTSLSTRRRGRGGARVA